MGPESAPTALTVIGVVNSARLWKVETVAPLAVYSLFGEKWQEYEPLLDVRTTVDPESLKPTIERLIRRFGYHDSVRSRTVEERLDSYISVQRITAGIAAFFAGLALLIAAAGVYGLSAYNVSTRTAELGIRSALGAQKQDLLKLVLAESLRLALYGCSGGLVETLISATWMRSMLFGVSPFDPVVLSAVILCLLGTPFSPRLGPPCVLRPLSQ